MQNSGLKVLDRTGKVQKRLGLLAAGFIFGLILAATGIVTNFVEHFIAQALVFKTAGHPHSSIWASLLPYHEIVKTLRDLTLLPGIAFVIGPFLFGLMKSGVMRARVMETGIPVEGFIKAINQYTASTRNGGHEYVTAFELEVRPSGIKPFDTSVNEGSKEVFHTDYALGSSIVVLYEPQTHIVRVPDPDFNEADHNRRARRLVKSTWFVLFAITKRWLKNNTALFIIMLFPTAVGFSVLLNTVEDPLKWILFSVAIIGSLITAIYSGLVSNERPNPEKQTRHTPPPFTGAG